MVPKALLVLAQDFDGTEYVTVRDALEGNGVAVLEAGSSLEAITDEQGHAVKPDLALDQVKIEDWNAIVFIGGKGARRYWDDPRAHLLVQAAWGSERVIGAIDSAIVILANSGALSGMRVAGDSAYLGKILDAGMLYRRVSVEKDGNVITADGPRSAEMFARELAKEIQKRK